MQPRWQRTMEDKPQFARHTPAPQDVHPASFMSPVQIESRQTHNQPERASEPHASFICPHQKLCIGRYDRIVKERY